MNELTSGATVLTLVGVAALLTAAALALERARVLPVPGWAPGWLGLAVMALALFDASTGLTLPTMAAFGIGWVIGLLGMEKESRARFAEVFATIAPAIDGEVVASDRLEGRWSTYSVDEPGGFIRSTIPAGKVIFPADRSWLIDAPIVVDLESDELHDRLEMRPTGDHPSSCSA